VREKSAFASRFPYFCGPLPPLSHTCLALFRHIFMLHQITHSPPYPFFNHKLFYLLHPHHHLMRLIIFFYNHQNLSSGYCSFYTYIYIYTYIHTVARYKLARGAFFCAWKGKKNSSKLVFGQEVHGKYSRNMHVT
jgi:hypothetical protein